MALVITEIQCSICNKEKNTYKCEGCSQHLCFNHLTEHRQIIKKQFDRIEDDHDQFRQKINVEKKNPKYDLLIHDINQWEIDSIEKIKQIAEQCREKVINSTNEYIHKLENKLNNLAKQLKEIREENEINEMDLYHLKEGLIKLIGAFHKSRNIIIKQTSASLINEISVITSFHTQWKQAGITIIGDRRRENQLYHPRGIFIDDDQTLYIADSSNHHILQWEANAINGRIVAGGNGRGNKTNQLNGPSDVIIDKYSNSIIIADRKNRRVMRWSRQNNTTNGEILISDIDCRSLAIDKDGSLYVSDYIMNEIKRWKRGEKHGTIVAGGNGKGNRLNQLNSPSYIFVDEEYSLYISDENNHRVMKWLKNAKEGIVVAGGRGCGNSLKQLCYPQGVVVDQLGQIYVAEWGNDRVTRWCADAEEGTIILGRKDEQQANQFCNPEGLSFDQGGNLYVTDCNNHRIQKFEIDFY